MPRLREQYVVAVVDDDASVCRAVGRLLAVHGFKSRKYASGSAFLGDAGQSHFDVVVLDLHMEGLTGLQVMRHLNDMQSRMPIVVLTGHGSPKARADALQYGASAFLEKPVDESVLISTIRSLLDSPALEPHGSG